MAIVDYDTSLVIHQSILPDALILEALHDSTAAVCQRTTLGFMANALMEEFYKKPNDKLDAYGIFLLAASKWIQTINNFDSGALRAADPNKTPIEHAVARGTVAEQGFFVADKLGGSKKHADDVEGYLEIFTVAIIPVLAEQENIKKAISTFLEAISLDEEEQQTLMSVFNNADVKFKMLINPEEKIVTNKIDTQPQKMGTEIETKQAARFTFVR